MENRMRLKMLLAGLLILSLVIIGCNSAEKDYEKAQQENTVEAFEKFIEKHPKSDFVSEAKSSIEFLKIVPGFGRCDPVIFKTISTPLTVKLSLINYVPYGPIQSYKLEIISDEEQISLNVKVNLGKFQDSGLCDDKTYTVEINGKEFSSPTVRDFESRENKNLIGFSPARVSMNPYADITQQEYRPEGAVLIIPGMNMSGVLEGDFITQFAYKGDFSYTRELELQKFTLNKVQYEIRYKDFQYNEQGRISGYTAELVESTN